MAEKDQVEHVLDGIPGVGPTTPGLPALFGEPLGLGI